MVPSNAIYSNQCHFHSWNLTVSRHKGLEFRTTFILHAFKPVKLCDDLGRLPGNPECRGLERSKDQTGGCSNCSGTK